jgi:hypothetical protein
VGCRVLKDGLPLAGVAAPSPTFAPAAGVTQNGGVYSFATPDTWTFTCQAEIEGKTVTGEVNITALNEAIKPSVAKVGEALGSVESGLADILAANGGDDALLVAAVNKLDAGLAKIAPDPSLNDVLRKVPGGYPDAGKLQAAGIMPSPDDAQLPGKLTALQSALSALKSAADGFDPANVTQADLDTMKARTAAVQSAVNDLTALSPSTHGLLATRAQVATLMRDHVTPATVSVGTFGSALAKASAPDVFAKAPDPQEVKGGGQTPYFGFLSLAIGMFGDSYLQIKLVKEWYGPYIEELDKSINNLIALDLIDYFFPPNPDGPVIDLMAASASVGFATPGYDTWIYGSGFNEDPEFNLVIVIGDQWQTILDQLFGACGVEDADTVPEKVEAIVDCIQEVQEAAQGIIDGIITPDEVVDPGFIWTQDVHIGEFPEACSGSLPLAIGVIPINLAVGRGPAFTTNCISN